MSQQLDVDAVVIGSGAGGMAAALCLARAGQRVLVLEQHYVPGGWCHSFTLGGYRFSPGVHYVGELGPGGRLRKIYEGLGVAGDLSFFELNPDGFDSVRVGGKRVDIPKGRERYAARLRERFPHEAQGIERYLGTIAALDGELRTLLRTRSLLDAALLPLRARTVLGQGLFTLERLLDRTVQNPVLRAVLAAQSGDYGLPPSRAPAVLHAGVAAHYFDGGYYPRGGGFAIPRAFLRGLRRHGGELRLRARVERVLLERERGLLGARWRAVGVRFRGPDGRPIDVRSRIVISNADPRVTYDLVGREHLSRLLRLRLGRTRWSTACLSLFLAVDMDLRAAGLTSANVWHTQGTDLEAPYRFALHGPRGDQPRDREPPALFLTATSLKDPSKPGRQGHHTLEAFCLYPYAPFRRWEGTRSDERGPDYEAFKERLSDDLLRAVARIVPGIEERVVFRALGTPLTNEHFVNASQGAMYGTEKGLSQLGPFGFGLTTEVPGLFLCGASTISHGVVGATMSGIACARTALGCRTGDLMSEGNPELRVHSAEDPTSWPADLRPTLEPAGAARR